mgnify:CR=1 FL=1
MSIASVSNISAIFCTLSVSICSNKFRNDNLICVVEDYKSVFMFEKTGNYEGKYHVLNGLISPIDGITPEELKRYNIFTKLVVKILKLFAPLM